MHSSQVISNMDDGPLMEKLVEKVLEKNKRAIAKAITLVENHPDECELFIKKIFPHTGRALVVGITGPPGPLSIFPVCL